MKILQFRLSTSVRWLLVGALAVIAAVGGYYLRQSVLGDEPDERVVAVPAPITHEGQRPTFALPDLEGVVHSASEWDGKLLVINFWATWCSPCRREIPHFIELQTKYAARGLQFVGVAIDELEKVKDFDKSMGINYPILLGQLDAIELSRTLGNRVGALPFTVVVDRQGQIVFSKGGEISRAQAERIILSHL